ncbi:hypothetical protein F4777DRAFT_539786 [Nemania sp. FL0916]|nr:hypothetical protein F4777DRAFT_539786 [Nemania sp. FL0916]
MKITCAILALSHGLGSGPGGKVHKHPACDGPSRTSVQPPRHDDHDGCGVNHDPQAIEGNGSASTSTSISTVSSHRSKTETVFSQDDAASSAVTGSTDVAPLFSNGHSHEEKETRAGGRVDGDDTFPAALRSLPNHSSNRAEILSDLGQSSATAADPRPAPSTEDMDFRDSGTSPSTGLATSSTGTGLLPHTLIMPSVNWRDTSQCAPASVDEAIDRFNAKFNRAGGSTALTVGTAHGLGVSKTLALAGRVAAQDGGPLNYPIIHGMVNKSQLTTILEPSRLEEACKFYQGFAVLPRGPLNSFCNHNRGILPAQDPALPTSTPVSSKDIVDSILQMITHGYGGSIPKIRCCAGGPRLGTSQTRKLRFGLNGRIVLHSLDAGQPITFVCCDETFPWPDWAKEAAQAFLEGAKPWAKAGLAFQQVDRCEPAHFRIAFSLFPGDMDCNVLAEAPFPGTKSPEERTLWIYLLAFHPFHRSYMAGYMGHEAGHIGGARHGFDEHLLSDGSEDPRLKSVVMGSDDPASVMNYHENNPGDYVVQASDIKDMGDMHGHSSKTYQGYDVIKIKPEVQCYGPMVPFDWMVGYLSSNA